MFTGIIEDLGTISAMTGSKLTVVTALSPVTKGDSISVNGVCLTVTSVSSKAPWLMINFDYTPETAGHTTLENLKPGARVNLERALKADSRLGGHFVTGHVEGTSVISGITKKGNSYIFSFKAGRDLMKYVAAKGSVAIEGISLTVADRSDDGFSVSVIPYTYMNTNLNLKNKRDNVNVETDIIAKYIENISNFNPKKQINIDFLKENGFI